MERALRYLAGNTRHCMTRNQIRSRILKETDQIYGLVLLTYAIVHFLET